MSTTLAIATVTNALATLLRKAREPIPGDPPSDTTLSDLEVTTLPPDKARTADANQLNVFLFNVGFNSAYRNIALPATGAGTLESAPLALDLHYLVTAYGQSNHDDAAHRVLGRAMSILHRHAVMFPSELSSALEQGGVHTQRERVRIVPSPMNIEEMSKLWTTFQTSYRLSVAYQVSVVLIESGARIRSAVPVLRSAVTTETSPTPRLPRLESIDYGPNRDSATLGSTASLHGAFLDIGELDVRFSHATLGTPITLPMNASSDGRTAVVTLPVVGTPGWVPGVYGVEVVRADGPRSESLPFALAPTLSSISPSTFLGGPGAEVDVDVTFSPAVAPSQRVELAIGSLVIASPTRTQSATTIRFHVRAASVGTHQARLRVDGVESPLPIVIDSGTGLATYGADHLVEVHS